MICVVLCRRAQGALTQGNDFNGFFEKINDQNK